MAAKFPSDSGIKLKPRKGHDMTWSCDKHAEPIKFYCKEHKIPICHPCATKDHGQKPCQLDDIEDVILEMRTKLDDKQSELDQLLQSCKKLNAKIQSCSIFVSNHLETVNAEVNIAYESKIKRAETKKKENILEINKEVDEKIRILNVDRVRRVASCIAEAEKEEQTIKETQAKRLTESKKIDTTIGKKMVDLTSKNQHNIDTVTNVDLKIKRIRQDDKTLVNEAPQVITSLDESVSVNVHRDIDACLARIQSAVERVKFVEGEIGGKQFARIDGFNGTWKLVKSFPLPLTLKSPRVCGLISDDECVFDTQNYDLYISNISNGHTNKVIEGDRNMRFISCAPIDSELIVFGKGRSNCNGDSLDGCITIYDRQWKVVRDITIPRNTSYINEVYVDVDKDGMILAAQRHQSNIYVINPADGKIVRTITIQGKKTLGDIQALSSGDIIVKTGDKKFTVISRSEEEKATTQHDEWDWPSSCRIDKLTDTLYITYYDAKRRIHAVDQVSHEGDIQARSIVEYKQATPFYLISPCTITPSGNLIACDGGNILEHKKTFHV